MSESAATVVIIGAGIVGASVAYHLAARGCTNVVVLEKAKTEATGSTARSAAGVRHQFASEVNIRLSLYSIERIKRFTEEIGGHADLKQVGYLLLVNDPQTWAQYQRNAVLQQSLGVRTQLLAPGEVLDILPQTRMDDLVGATFCADDGYCDPHGIATGYLARARDLGVQLKRATPATGIRRARARVLAVETPQGAIGCDVVVNAAGPWAGQVGALAQLEIPVQPFRRCIYMTEPFPLIPNDIPLTIDVGSGFYLRKEGHKVLFGMSNENE
ncbi:MAG: NAD(P)/FAD-dependent oxidoreductase, partial [Blastocatellia bacterium]